MGTKRTWLVVAGLLTAALAVLLFFGSGREIPLPDLLELTLPTERAPGSLKVPIVRYERESQSGQREIIDFVGAVHLGERSYYDQLNQRFKSYDAVLFELVADPEAFKQRSASDGQSSLGVLQQSLANLLGLTFQLSGIDYRAPNFVHADLSPEQLSDAMSSRGESLVSLLMKIIRVSFDPKVKEEMRRAGYEEPELEGVNPLLVALRGPTSDERKKIKIFFAQGLISSDILIKAMQGEQGLSLIDDRNAAALKVALAQLEAGRHTLAIFYGVGHLPDLHERLTKQLGFSITKVDWVEAWRL